MIHTLLWSVFFLVLLSPKASSGADNLPFYVYQSWTQVQELFQIALQSPVDLAMAIPPQVHSTQDGNLEIKEEGVLRIETLPNKTSKSVWELEELKLKSEALVTLYLPRIRLQGLYREGPLRLHVHMECQSLEARMDSVEINLNLISGEGVSFNLLPLRVVGWGFSKAEAQRSFSMSEPVCWDIRTGRRYSGLSTFVRNQLLDRLLVFLETQAKSPQDSLWRGWETALFEKVQRKVSSRIFSGQENSAGELMESSNLKSVDFYFQKHRGLYLFNPEFSMGKLFSSLPSQNMKEIPEFARLLNSRAKQLWIWPDLRYVQKELPIDLKCKTTALSLGPTTPVNLKLDSLTFNLSLQCTLWVNRSSEQVPYLDFFYSLALNWRAQTGFQVVNISKGEGRLREDYSRRFRPNPRFPAQTLTDNIRSGLVSKIGRLNQDHASILVGILGFEVKKIDGEQKSLILYWNDPPSER